MPDWCALAGGLDAVVLHGPLDAWPDAKNVLDGAWKACEASSRLVLVQYSGFWRRCLRLVTRSSPDVGSLLGLARFELVATQQRVLIPFRIPLVRDWINRWLAPLPLLRSLCVATVMVARPLKRPREALSVSIIVPARNEAGTIDALVRRLPEMGADDELIFVEGHSTDGTWEAIQRAIAARSAGSRMTAVRQPGVGKADAVRHGFELATKDLLMILDADLTVPPEELPLFYRAIASDAAEFINGNRLTHAMDRGAMQSANVVGNKFFARILSYLLGQPIGDPLCGTKVLRRTDYDRLRRRQMSNGHADPFGDFELLFGAAALGLKIAEVPVHYRRRVYGTTKIRRWRHGCELLRMTLTSTGRTFVRSPGHSARFSIQRWLLAVYRYAHAAGAFRSSFGQAIFAHGYRCYKRWLESPEIHRLRPYVPAGTTAIDVGAGLGFFVPYLAKWVGEDGVVLAIEPEPANVHRLTSRRPAMNVDVIESAAAECTGRARLAVDVHHPGGHRLGMEGLSVAAVSLDDLLRDRVCPPVSFIKIDTQGAEMRVLLGARSILRRTRPALWVELDAAALEAQGSTPDDVVGLLDREGYAPYHVGVWSGIRPLTPEQVVRWCRTTPYANFLFLPASPRSASA